MPTSRRISLLLVTTVVVLFSCYTNTSPSRLWKTLFMDSSEMSVSGDNDCDVIRPIRNDDMSEGDYYIVKSDAFNGRPHINRRPFECTLSFNLGDRLVSVAVKDWSCNKPFVHPLLAIYDDCEGRRKGLLATYNCTTNVTIPTIAVQSTTYCVTIYHYRGSITSGYFFSMQITALHEILAFPAGGIAAVIISAVVIAMVLVKIVCVISGYERRLPDVAVEDDEDQKEILTSSCDTEWGGGGGGGGVGGIDNWKGNSSTLPRVKMNHQGDITYHDVTKAGLLERKAGSEPSILRYSRSPRGSTFGHGGFPPQQAGEGQMDAMTSSAWFETGAHGACMPRNRSEPDYDFLDVSIDGPMTTPPTTASRHFMSTKTMPIWRH